MFGKDGQARQDRGSASISGAAQPKFSAQCAMTLESVNKGSGESTSPSTSVKDDPKTGGTTEPSSDRRERATPDTKVTSEGRSLKTSNVASSTREIVHSKDTHTSSKPENAEPSEKVGQSDTHSLEPHWRCVNSEQDAHKK